MDSAVQGYRELSEVLREQIERGDYPPAAQLPTENALSQQHAINRHTVRAALQTLERDGYIYRIRGKGTFVARRRLPYSISPSSSFTASIRQLGLEGSMKVLRVYIQPATEVLADVLAMTTNEDVLLIEFLRSIEGVPTCVTSSHFRYERVRGLEKGIQSATSLYEELRTNCGVEGIHRCWSEIEAVMPEPRDQEILHMPAQLPLLASRSLIREGNGDPLEYCISRYRSDAFTLRVDLEEKGTLS